MSFKKGVKVWGANLQVIEVTPPWWNWKLQVPIFFQVIHPNIQTGTLELPSLWYFQASQAFPTPRKESCSLKGGNTLLY